MRTIKYLGKQDGRKEEIRTEREKQGYGWRRNEVETKKEW